VPGELLGGVLHPVSLDPPLVPPLSLGEHGPWATRPASTVEQRLAQEVIVRDAVTEVFSPHDTAPDLDLPGEPEKRLLDQLIRGAIGATPENGQSMTHAVIHLDRDRALKGAERFGELVAFTGRGAGLLARGGLLLWHNVLPSRSGPHVPAGGQLVARQRKVQLRGPQETLVDCVAGDVGAATAANGGTRLAVPLR